MTFRDRYFYDPSWNLQPGFRALFVPLRIFITVFLLLGVSGTLRAALPQEELEIVRGGVSPYAVVVSSEATEPEKYAAAELVEFVQRVTGARLPVVEEKDWSKDQPAIFVGWTRYATEKGIEGAQFGEEEWAIRTDGGHLVITGGRPRGTLYGVYEFLEKYLGCHWLDARTEIIPSKPDLVLGAIDERRKPRFWLRQIWSPTGTPDDKWKFKIRNKVYRMGGRTDFFPEGAFYDLEGSPGGNHTMSYYVNAKDWFATHPEYFSLNAKGERVPAYDGAGPGQLCLTNPDVKRLTLEKLRQFIKQDRKKAAEAGLPPPKIYTIDQNDRYDAHCQCEACQEIAKREESESGPLIAFINDIAEGIEKEYPDVIIETYAYNKTAPAPKTVKPRKNVLVKWCDVYSISDLVFPLTDPRNAKKYKELMGWARLGTRLGIFDYWENLTYYPYFPTPFSIIQTIGPDLRLFADAGAETYFSEAADYTPNLGENFVPLKFWLAYKLLDDPYQPEEDLIKTFMSGYYGDAAELMGEYRSYLEGRIGKEAGYQVTRDEPHNLAYLDLEFFVTADKLLAEAERRVEGVQPQAANVQRERFVVDSALLHLWPWLERKLPDGGKMPFDHEAVVKRYSAAWDAYLKNWYHQFYTHNLYTFKSKGDAANAKRLKENIVGLFADPQLPEPFRDLPSRDVADFNWLTFSPITPRMLMVDDDDAAGGMAAMATKAGAIEAAEEGGDKGGDGTEAYGKPVVFGVRGGPSVTLKPEDIPQDGKFHLFRIGKVNVRKNTQVWALEGKLLGVNVGRLVVPRGSDPGVNEWEAYISLKFEGPAYVKGSTKPNRVLMDRVLMVKRHEHAPSEAAKELPALPRIVLPRAGKPWQGNLSEVPWSEGVKMGAWRTLRGAETGRVIHSRLLQDGEYLYVRLEEEGKTGDLVSDSGVYAGDDWEFLVAPTLGERPYRQLAVNPEGKILEKAYGESDWESGAKVVSEMEPDRWRVSLALPLKGLTPGGVKPGQSLFVNMMRGGNEPLVWIPTGDDDFHALDFLGEIVFQ